MFALSDLVQFLLNKKITLLVCFFLLFFTFKANAQWNPFKSSCQEQSVIDKKHNMCSKLDITRDPKGNLIQTYGCATRNGEAFVDYYVKGNQLCYKSTFHY